MKYRQGCRVQEIATGAYGRVARGLWLVDLKTDTPAEPAYIVKFENGREKRCIESQLAVAKAMIFADIQGERNRYDEIPSRGTVMLDRETSCNGKKFYSTAKLAKKVAQECMEARPLPKLRFYQCGFCGMFHLTSSPLHSDMSRFLDFILSEMTAADFSVLIGGHFDAERLSALARERENYGIAMHVMYPNEY